jgi:hypothetical protein
VCMRTSEGLYLLSLILFFFLDLMPICNEKWGKYHRYALGNTKPTDKVPEAALLPNQNQVIMGMMLQLMDVLVDLQAFTSFGLQVNLYHMYKDK